jgi:ABC-2 type transport system permease protein
VGELRYGLGIWWRLAGARARAQLQYPASFALLCAASLVGPAVDLVALRVVFANTPALAGWTSAEVVLLFSLTGLTFWTADAVVGAVETLPQRIKDGTFDALLLRPVPSLVQVSADGIAFRRFTRTALALVLVPVALARADVAWTPARAAALVAALVAGFALFAAVFVTTSAVAFWLVDAREFGNAFTYGGAYLGSQPLDIYAAWLRRFVTYLLPIAFAVYLPVAYLLGKPYAGGLPRGAVALTPLVALACVLAAGAVWRGGVRHYQSTGS